MQEQYKTMQKQAHVGRTNSTNSMRRAQPSAIEAEERRHRQQIALQIGADSLKAPHPNPSEPGKRLPKKLRPLCGAKTRDGSPCQARAVPGMIRCRMHGGNFQPAEPNYAQQVSSVIQAQQLEKYQSTEEDITTTLQRLSEQLAYENRASRMATGDLDLDALISEVKAFPLSPEEVEAMDRDTAALIADMNI